MAPESDASSDDLPCVAFVQLVTDYLEGALEPRRRAEVDHHLGECPGCRTVLEQWRQVITLCGRLDGDEVDRVDPTVRASLVDAFCRAHPAGD